MASYYSSKRVVCVPNLTLLSSMRRLRLVVAMMVAVLSAVRFAFVSGIHVGYVLPTTTVLFCTLPPRRPGDRHCSTKTTMTKSSNWRLLCNKFSSSPRDAPPHNHENCPNENSRDPEAERELSSECMKLS
jgi:hypothetical protein